MTISATPAAPNLKAKTIGTQFLPADTTAAKTIFTAGANGSRIYGIEVVTSDTAANDIVLAQDIAAGGTAYPLGAKRVAAGSGNGVATPTASVSLLDPSQFPGWILPDGTAFLGPGDLLKANMVATITTAKAVTIVVTGVDYQ